MTVVGGGTVHVGREVKHQPFTVSARSAAAARSSAFRHSLILDRVGVTFHSVFV